MRIPIRSEFEAYRLVVAAVLSVGVAVLVGWLTEPVIGAAVFAAILVLGVVAYLRAPNPDRHTPLRDAANAAHPHGPAPGRRHVLVIANETLAGEELRERILAGNGGRIEIDVLAPVLLSRVHLGYSDIDTERARAQERLERSLAWARKQGIAARGEIGDPSATTAISDELRDFGADEVIVVTHSSEQQSWQERQELERLESELDVAVTQVVLDGSDAPAGEVDPAL